MTNETETNYFEVDWQDFPHYESQGYLHFYMPAHPMSRRNGVVAVHRHVMAVHLGRWLRDDEIVSFRNGKRDDIRLENLELMSNAELLNTNTGRTGEKTSVEMLCAICKQTFITSPGAAKRRRHCSPHCARIASRRFNLAKEELERLVWEMPTTHIAAEHGVSDKAIEKWCKKWGISKPSRGYWAKLYSGQQDPSVTIEIKCTRS